MFSADVDMTMHEELTRRRAELERQIAEHSQAHDRLLAEIAELQRSHDMLVGALREVTRLLELQEDRAPALNGRPVSVGG